MNASNTVIAINKIVPQKILLIRTDRIGDVILTLPMVDTLHYNFPDAKIDFLVNNRVFEIVSGYPNINKVHGIEKDSISLVKSICRENKYDTAIVVHPRLGVSAGVYMAGVKQRIGSAYRWYSFFFNMKHAQHRKDSLKSEMEYNLDLLDELDCVRIEGLKPQLAVDSAAIESMRRKLAANGMKPEDEYIVVHIPSLGSAKVWSDENFILLINQLLASPEFKYDIILTGTNEEAWHVQSVYSKLNGSKRVFKVLDLELNELAALLKYSRLFIGNSSGPIHLAAAVGTFVIGLYSPARVESPLRWGPQTEKKIIFVPEKDDNSRNVMDDIMAEDVSAMVLKQLKRGI